LVSVDSNHQDSPNYRWNREEDDSPAFALDLGRSPSAANDSDDLDHTKRDIEQDRLEVSEAKVFDDEIAESANAATRDPEFR
jgi:hypothetical protein